MKTPIDFDGFIQVAIIVKDIEKARKYWCRLFNVPEPPISVAEPGPVDGTSYRGKPANYGLKLCAIPAKDKGFIIELHQPLGGDSTFQEFVDKHGQGVHHLGFAMGPKTQEAIDSLKEEGFQTRTEGKGGSWTIVDTEDTLGVNLNIKPHG
jgi:catechol 2,3-dioxygenase-like lactoylglutathione lyase family enzyme